MTTIYRVISDRYAQTACEGTLEELQRMCDDAGWTDADGDPIRTTLTIDAAGRVIDEDDEVVAVPLGRRRVEVYEQTHNGANWETIPGAAWDMEIRAGETFRQACLRNGGDFTGHGAFRLVTFINPGTPIPRYAEEFDESDFAGHAIVCDRCRASGDLRPGDMTTMADDTRICPRCLHEVEMAGQD